LKAGLATVGREPDEEDTELRFRVFLLFVVDAFLRLVFLARTSPAIIWGVRQSLFMYLFVLL
jgi:hypothetical protein